MAGFIYLYEGTKVSGTYHVRKMDIFVDFRILEYE